MSYTAEQNKISRTKINLLKLKMGFCRHSYGNAPCTATAVEKCYNTFPTCRDKSNYDNVGKEYRFCSANLPASVVNEFDPVFPYIKSISDLPTEIKEEDTVVKRLKVDLYDDTDYGVNVDPYWEERHKPQSFWKTFIQRNKNYRNGMVELWEGFAGIAEDEFEMKFAGKLDNFEYGGGVAKIEAVDLLKELSNIKYPLKVDVRLASDLGNVFIANNQAEMLTLNAITNDYCRRTDFESISSLVLAPFSWPTGNLTQGITYYIKVVAYDSDDMPTHTASSSCVLNPFTAENSIAVTFTAPTGASYYRIFIKMVVEGAPYLRYYQTTNNAYSIFDYEVALFGEPPVEANRYYELTGDDPTDLNDWTLREDYNFSASIEGNQITQLPASGYVRINKEIIYYASYYLSAGTYYLSGMRRVQFDTEADRHYEGTYLAVLLNTVVSWNPFNMLKYLLQLAGIDSNYIAWNFGLYASDWITNSENPLVTLKPIIKDIKLSRLYFDLVRLVNCMSWVNEDGEIDILKHDEDYPDYIRDITDEANIISGSLSVDYNEEDRLTRWILFWNRFDIEESIDEANAYSRINIVVDADAETDKEYGDIKEDEHYTVWFSEDSDDVTKINTYVDALLQKRATRTRDAREIVECQVELKDAIIKTGYSVKLSTKHLQDIYGEDYNEVKFRVIKKEMMSNKIALTLLRLK